MIAVAWVGLIAGGLFAAWNILALIVVGGNGSVIAVDLVLAGIGAGIAWMGWRYIKRSKQHSQK